MADDDQDQDLGFLAAADLDGMTRKRARASSPSREMEGSRGKKREGRWKGWRGVVPGDPDPGRGHGRRGGGR